MAFGQQREHLFDLHDLFRRAAKKAEQRFAERLAQNPQTGKFDEALRQMRIAAPGQRIRELASDSAGLRNTARAPRARWPRLMLGRAIARCRR